MVSVAGAMGHVRNSWVAAAGPATRGRNEKAMLINCFPRGTKNRQAIHGRQRPAHTGPGMAAVRHPIYISQCTTKWTSVRLPGVLDEGDGRARERADADALPGVSSP